MKDYFDYSDTSDVSDDQLRIALDKAGYSDTHTSIARGSEKEYRGEFALARFIRDFQPELLVDPLDAAIGEAFDRLPSTRTRETFVKSVGETLRECGMELEREKSQ